MDQVTSLFCYLNICADCTTCKATNSQDLFSELLLYPCSIHISDIPNRG